MPELSYGRRCAAEAAGTALLLAVVVGSGIMGERLAAGNGALALLANSLATGVGLTALILAFAPLSGAHFNPLVSLMAASARTMDRREVVGYVAAQVAGGIAGVAAAHLMFEQPVLMLSRQARPGAALVFSEAVATFGLLATIRGAAAHGLPATAVAVGGYIAAAYWFTASTSFANPAVTLARTLTDTFTGIRPADAPGFIAGQVAGAAAAVVFFRWMESGKETRN